MKAKMGQQMKLPLTLQVELFVLSLYNYISTVTKFVPLFNSFELYDRFTHK